MPVFPHVLLKLSMFILSLVLVHPFERSLSLVNCFGLQNILGNSLYIEKLGTINFD